MSQLNVDNINVYTASSVSILSNLKLQSVPAGSPVNNLGIDSSGIVVIGTGGGGSGDSYWTSGSTGSYSVKSLNDSGISSLGNYSHAEGRQTTASGNDGSHSEGFNTKATGQSSHSEGLYTTAIGSGSHTEGYATTASGAYSHAENYATKALAHYSHAGGYQSSVISGFGSFVHSQNSVVTADRCAVLGGESITGSTSDTVYVPRLETAQNGEGIIMRSPNGTRYKLTIDNSGTISVSAV